MKKKATIITYGCAMNVNESAKIKNILQNMGYDMTDDLAESDAVFLNTCTVREGAATQIYGKLGELKPIKEKRGTIIGVTGCFAQEQGEELAKKFKQIDIVMGNQNIGKIPQAMEKLESGDFKHVVFVGDEDELPPRIDADFDSKKTASIPITYGCNNFCTYCIVPYVRGRERSVPMNQILDEVKRFVEKEYREVILLGQNVNSYGNDSEDKEMNFARLLEEICKIEGDFLVRFISPHPRDFTDDVIDVIAANEKIARCLHLPLQSGSSRVLKAMNRGYTKEEYIALAAKIKERVPGAALTADIIVGFPGETEEDFLDTLDVVRTSKFDNAFMFMYSPRKGTKAATMDCQIDQEVKKERLQRLIEVQNEASKELSLAFVGKTEKVFVEGPSKKNKAVLSSRTSTNKIVLFEGESSLEGEFVEVKITDAKTWTLYGELVKN
ncbi:tRNA-2-methylthio-N(6)-dimethylallyladenosine synthase [Propionigenium maris DSM 9537]|uniref:tRNA-2-methylthio-N(6)-dimethylallyladenosine synthase n=1 Tax=Propionigenium maris DSM 9537 TaxID=1123000 RepID=A0A9W6LNL0_9FUSO|nr:tRNA (N6-isopentenyl adenosine(37)-C2)-methylthiotransferase MiaB [Propionigenium maris]GLI56045.1 tRNA-2-methylthio-N(6)-dimethylallyladenosine synthase [Propionigenium maris DSM 9537]